MCGILGMIGGTTEHEARFPSALASLSHRGPDHQGTWKNDAVILGHRRLSIMDVDGGHQPLQCPQSGRALVCNGEIYNYAVLKRRLDGYPFQTQSDSEVVLPLYGRRGGEAAGELDGMFSLLIAEGSGCFAARDPVGIKPLYYGTAGGGRDKTLLFASELKALVGMAERIREFPGGHWFHSGRGLRPYYRVPDPEEFLCDREAAARRVRAVLEDSVRKRLMSDVPVGVFLSGGLDSSIVAALMKRHVPELHSFAVGMEGAPDLEAARVVAAHLGTVHHEHTYTGEDVLGALPEVIYHLESWDPALIRSAVPCYFVSRLARERVKVVLSGEGSDELFCGYSYLADYDDPRALQQESRRILNGLHNINLQRVDRMTMAHGLEGRVPFLDTRFIETVLEIDPRLKARSAFGIEKGILRKACEDLLPRDIVWRDKMEFAQGAGSSTLLQKAAEQIPGHELAAARRNGLPVSTGEELLYHRIFRRHFRHADAEVLVGRWKGVLH
ncbi:MAG: asparagine synthase B [Spirochaetota bacterium]